ncbi:lysophospholipid acyltransferase family protein [Pontibaca methylaminivorans]|uniref:DUF374 domain-containing protein n=1 Tax=Pontibaca methylaminivorans TaxID=515897 RepID=A0A1R3WMK7_9RHOB|nr:DUF374 domain-containing protein [Pontibaca methylaminivorans]SIT79360.1 hypothetical protein SAMN05421849_1123 [Pontibaca methylaminivorans]
MSLRKKIANSAWFNRSVEGLVAGWIRLSGGTTRWERTGFGPLHELLGSGEPVIMVLWHQNLAMAPYMFDLSRGPLCTLTSAARAGRLVGQVLARFGFDTVPMSLDKRHVTLSRAVLRKIHEGKSIGIAIDGPNGPARKASAIPLMWARTSGCRIFCVSYSAHRAIRLPTWDRTILPLPWTRGVMLCREWEQAVPRKAGPEQIEALRLDLEAALNDVADACDRATGQLPRQPDN